ncbi:MAG: hypothetical protein BWY70_00608 [Bacteroidetes bacterium ADurb.Bin408]|nr:MAG: hypothetical protein BWY70_00608 [Bacteroidetes bacterium ADurb.Bin408]
MVGAMSIIRFRTAVKDAADIMFIFFALAIGLACGVKLFSVAIFATLFIGFIYILIVKLNFAVPKRREFLLQIVIQNALIQGNPYDKILRNFCRRYKLVNTKSLGEAENEILEMSFYVNLKNEDKGKDMVGELKKIDGVKQVNLFFDED